MPIQCFDIICSSRWYAEFELAPQATAESVYGAMTPSESSLMQQYLSATDTKIEDELATALLCDHALPVIRKTLTRRLRGTSEQDREDVAGDVTLQLLARLKSQKQQNSAVIERFSAYVAVCAQNACDRYLRRRYPGRHRLKNRLRYLIGKMPEFALWEDPEHGWVCGNAALKGTAPKAVPQDLVARLGPADRNPKDLLRQVFRDFPGPIDSDALVGIFAELWGIRDQATQVELLEESTASQERPVDDFIAGRQRLEQLWREITSLPVSQRAALLLNLRDPAEGSAVWLLPASGIASIRQIAEFTGIPAAEFAELWPRLPLSDLEIADRLGIARQQVINLRQAARQRLARRARKESE